jgi:hypothetical protein
VFSYQAEAQIDNMASAKVGAGTAQVSDQLGRCADFLQCVSQHGHAVRIEFTTGGLSS